MARPKEFDHYEAVLKAAALFGRQGYEATSVRHLLDELGISSSSFYAAFGGKEQLFMEALAAHAEIERDQLRLLLVGTGTFRDQFKGLLDALIAELTSGGGTSSLTLRAAIELAASKPEALAFLSQYLSELIGMVAGLITAATERGDLEPAYPAEHLARYLLFSAFNLGFVAKVSSRRETLEGYAAIALHALDDRQPSPAFPQPTA